MRLYLLSILFVFLLTPRLVVAQDNKLDSILNIVLFGEDDFYAYLNPKKKYQFLYARLDHHNKTYFAGRDIGIDIYNTTGQLAYFHSSGLNAGIAHVWYSDYSDQLNTTLLTAGYSGKFGKSRDYRYRISYDRYFFNNNDSVLESSFNSSINLGTTIDKGVFGTRLDVAFLLGKEFGSQISLDLFGDFKVMKLNHSGKIKFEPEVSFYVGSEDLVYAEYGGEVGDEIIDGIPVTYVTEEKFGLMNTTLKLPLSVYYRNFDLELGYRINFPRSLVSTTSYDITSYFNFSIGYLFDLSK